MRVIVTIPTSPVRKHTIQRRDMDGVLRFAGGGSWERFEEDVDGKAMDAIMEVQDWMQRASSSLEQPSPQMVANLVMAVATMGWPLILDTPMGVLRLEPLP